jgi:hypothetical protein
MSLPFLKLELRKKGTKNGFFSLSSPRALTANNRCMR